MEVVNYLHDGHIKQYTKERGESLTVRASPRQPKGNSVQHQHVRLHLHKGLRSKLNTTQDNHTGYLGCGGHICRSYREQIQLEKARCLQSTISSCLISSSFLSASSPSSGEKMGWRVQSKVTLSFLLQYVTLGKGGKGQSPPLPTHPVHPNEATN